MSDQTFEQLVESLKQKARESWSGRIGEERAEQLEAFVTKMAENYASVLGLEKLEVLAAIEKRRNYSAVNYYQAANFPMLEDVTVYATKEEALAAFGTEGFRCPMCKRVSRNPYECDSGAPHHDGTDGKVCDWKSWGLFRTCGNGHRCVVRETFLEHPVAHELFMPVKLEREAAAA